MTSTTTQTVAAETDAAREQRVIAGKSKPASKPKPAKPAEPSKSELQRIVFAALMKAAGDIVDSPPAGVTKTQAREILRQRQQYVPSAAKIWDPRLGPAPK